MSSCLIISIYSLVYGHENGHKGEKKCLITKDSVIIETFQVNQMLRYSDKKKFFTNEITQQYGITE